MLYSSGLMQSIAPARPEPSLRMTRPRGRLPSDRRLLDPPPLPAASSQLLLLLLLLLLLGWPVAGHGDRSMIASCRLAEEVTSESVAVPERARAVGRFGVWPQASAMLATEEVFTFVVPSPGCGLNATIRLSDFAYPDTGIRVLQLRGDNNSSSQETPPPLRILRAPAGEEALKRTEPPRRHIEALGLANQPSRIEISFLRLTGGRAWFHDDNVQNAASESPWGHGGSVFVGRQKLGNHPTGNPSVELHILGVVFKDNQAFGGGALAIEGFATVKITDTTFEANTASARGGGALLLSPRCNATDKVGKSRVQTSGATSFHDNVALFGGRGAGIRVWRGYDAVLTLGSQTRFEGNQINSTSCSRQKGVNKSSSGNNDSMSGSNTTASISPSLCLESVYSSMLDADVARPQVNAQSSIVFQCAGGTFQDENGEKVPKIEFAVKENFQGCRYVCPATWTTYANPVHGIDDAPWKATAHTTINYGDATDSKGDANTVAVSPDGKWALSTSRPSSYIFRRAKNGDAWDYMNPIKLDFNYGFSADISNRHAIVCDYSNGGCRIYTLDLASGKWGLTPSEYFKVQVASYETKNLGYTCAITERYAAVGKTPVLVFKFDANAAGSSRWQHVKSIPFDPSIVGPQWEAYFAYKIAMTDNYLAISAPRETRGDGHGAQGYVFMYQNKNPAEGTIWSHVATLTSDRIITRSGEYSVSATGDWGYSRSDMKGHWFTDSFGYSGLDITDSYVVVGAPGLNTAYLFANKGNTTHADWDQTPTTKLTPTRPNDVPRRNKDGSIIDTSWDFVHRPTQDEYAEASTAKQNEWKDKAKEHDVGDVESGAGYFVSISENYVIVGSYFDDPTYLKYALPNWFKDKMDTSPQLAFDWPNVSPFDWVATYRVYLYKLNKTTNRFNTTPEVVFRVPPSGAPNPRSLNQLHSLRRGALSETAFVLGHRCEEFSYPGDHYWAPGEDDHYPTSPFNHHRTYEFVKNPDDPDGGYMRNPNVDSVDPKHVLPGAGFWPSTDSDTNWTSRFWSNENDEIPLETGTYSDKLPGYGARKEFSSRGGLHSSSSSSFQTTAKKWFSDRNNVAFSPRPVYGTQSSQGNCQWFIFGKDLNWVKERRSNDPGLWCKSKCPKGHFCPGPGNLLGGEIPCPIGRYADVDGLSACKTCPGGKVTALPGADTVDLCDGCGMGSELTSDFGQQLTCRVCPSGWYQPLAPVSRDIECQACPEGRYIVDDQVDVFEHNTLSDCKKCSKGREFVGPSHECSICPSGKYQDREDAVGIIVCKDCPVARYLLDDKSDAGLHDSLGRCKHCERGHEFQNASTPCKICAAGRYNDQDASDTENCTLCGRGKFNGDRGEVLSKHNDAGDCFECPPGQNAEVGAMFCVTCPPGKVSSVEEVCEDCPRGKKSTSLVVQGIGFCADCGAGMYQADEGQPFCLPCIPGSFGNETGLVACHDCVAGTMSESSNSSSCSQCKPGQYQNVRGSASCVPCIPGSFSNVSGMSACHDCTAGKVSALSNSTECTNCKPGLYLDAPGQASCLPCVPGRVQPSWGGQNCTACRPGRFMASLRRGACKTCPLGWYADVGASKCDRVPPGSFLEEGSRVKLCAAGHRCRGGDAPQEICAAGFYQESNGSAICLACRGGSFGKKNFRGCVNCPAGWKRHPVDDPDASRCISCPSGWQSDAGANSCDPCPLGKYGSVKGICSDCPKGRYNDDKGLLSCKGCREDTFGTKTGATAPGECQDCKVAFAPFTTTMGRTGVSDPATGCVCAGGEPDGVGQAVQGYYMSDDATVERLMKESDPSKRAICAPCPDGGDCAEDGTDISTLSAKAGFWRPTSISKVFSDCSKGYKGVDAVSIAESRCCPLDPRGPKISSCRVNVSRSNSSEWTPDSQCSANYRGTLCLECVEGFVKVGEVCQRCPGGAVFGSAFAAGLLMSVPVCLGTMVFLIFAKTEKTAEAGHKIFGQLKIFVAFVQILAAMPTVLNDVPWPQSFLSFTVPFTAINFDFVGLLGFGMCSLSVRFADKFVVHMCLPPVFTLAIFLGYVFANMLRPPMTEKVKHHRKAQAIKLTIALLLFMYSGLATRCFTMLKCSNFKGLDYQVLEADPGMVCRGETHSGYIAMSVVFILLYIIGIPLGMWLALWRNRKVIMDQNSARNNDTKFVLAGLYSQYEPRWWYFEIIIILHKCIMTGAMVVIARGSAAQPLVATLVQMSFLLLVLKAGPYQEGSDDWGSFVCSFVLTLTTLLGFALIMDRPKVLDGTQVTMFDRELLGGLLVAVNAIGVAYEMGIMVWTAWQERRESAVKKKHKRASVKVVATQPRMGAERSDLKQGDAGAEGALRDWQ